jgi:hypothetical protein
MIVHDLATGDGVKAARALLPSSEPIGLFGYGLQLGVQCREYVPLTSQDQMRAAGKQALPDFPDAVLSLLPQTPYVFSDCAAWRVPSAGPGLPPRPVAMSRCCWSAARLTGSLRPASLKRRQARCRIPDSWCFRVAATPCSAHFPNASPP